MLNAKRRFQRTSKSTDCDVNGGGNASECLQLLVFAVLLARRLFVFCLDLMICRICGVYGMVWYHPYSYYVVRVVSGFSCATRKKRPGCEQQVPGDDDSTRDPQPIIRPIYIFY